MSAFEEQLRTHIPTEELRKLLRPKRRRVPKAKQFVGSSWSLDDADEVVDNINVDFPYQSLGDVVLGANQDIRYHKALVNPQKANVYARAHKLTAVTDKDFNSDGVNDIVLFNAAGQPVVINGYSMQPSEFPYKRAYYEINPTRIQQIEAGGYKNWANRFVSNEANADDIAEWSRNGNKLLKPRKHREPTARNKVDKAIQEVIKAHLVRAADGNVGLARLLYGILPRLSLGSYIYEQAVEPMIMQFVPTLVREANSLDEFKKLISHKNVKGHIDEWLSRASTLNEIQRRVDVQMPNYLGQVLQATPQQVYSAINVQDFNTIEGKVQKERWRQMFAERCETLRDDVVQQRDEEIQRGTTLALPAPQ